MILLDTHAAVWLITENPSLGPESRAALKTALSEQQLSVSAITFWEISLLVAKGRMDALRSPAAQRMTILNSGISEIPITGDIAILSVDLNGLRGDPADRLIMATAIVHGATLMTADAELLRWPHAIRRHDAST